MKRIALGLTLLFFILLLPLANTLASHLQLALSSPAFAAPLGGLVLALLSGIGAAVAFWRWADLSRRLPAAAPGAKFLLAGTLVHVGLMLFMALSVLGHLGDSGRLATAFNGIGQLPGLYLLLIGAFVVLTNLAPRQKA